MLREFSLTYVLEEVNLGNLTDAESVRLLELAKEEVYDIVDMPERWRTLFKRLE